MFNPPPFVTLKQQHNTQIAANLNAPVIMVARGDGGETATQLHDRAKIGAQVFQLAKADVLGLVVNKAPAKDRSLVASQLARRLSGSPLSFLGALPYDEILASIRLDQIHAALGAKVSNVLLSNTMVLVVPAVIQPPTTTCLDHKLLYGRV